jgi:lipopolysaccharide transport system ATP-binding protein
MSGAILGMSRAVIDKKFTETSSFAEVERFLDTPVKRYSSGMYVRLAFAVAAHLDSDVLLIDEVLAVGDAEFQRRCLGKMRDVVQQGRTILFVSHNMQAIQALCQRVILIDGGTLKMFDRPEIVISEYLAGQGDTGSERHWPKSSAPGSHEFRLVSIRALRHDGKPGAVFSSRDAIDVEIEFDTSTIHPALCVGFDVVNELGTVLLRSYQTDMAADRWPVSVLGKNRWCCRLPAGLLNGGTYMIVPKVGLHNMYWIIEDAEGIQFRVILDHGVSPFWNALDERNRPGLIAPLLDWRSCSVD